MRPPTTPSRKIVTSIMGLCSLLGYASGAYAQTTTIAPTPYQTVFDAGGDPVSGACIWTYLASTSTPATTYSAAGPIASAPQHANPIRADSAGRFDVWLAPGTSYKFVYEAACVPPAHGTVIRTVDGIAGMLGTTNPTVDVHTADVRCTLTSGVPVTTANVTAATTLYVTPYNGNRIALYDGVGWNMRPVTETGIAVPNVANLVYDVFAYDNSTVPAYVAVPWVNDTTRAALLVTTDGVLSLTGFSGSRRYLCSFRTTAVAGQTEDSTSKRYVWNYDHRVRRPLRAVETAGSWTYSTATLRQANANAANQVDVVVGWAEATLDLTLASVMTNTNAGWQAFAAIGESSTTTVALGSIQASTAGAGGSANIYGTSHSRLIKQPAVGRNFYTWLEYSVTAATTTWLGTNAVGTISGLHGWIDG